MMFRLTAAALLALLPLAKASPGGAPTCVGDESAPGDPHRAAGFTEETIAEGGLTITIGGETLEEGTPLDLVVGDTYEVTISTESSFRGVLARMAGGDAGVDTLGLFTVVDGDTSLQVSSFCDAAEVSGFPNLAPRRIILAPVLHDFLLTFVSCMSSRQVAGVTHTSRADKTSVTFLMSLDEPSQNMALDVNVVESNPNPSVFYYTQYLINAVAAPTGAPTSAPTSAPSGAPTVVPTVFPTMAPVSIYETGVAANFTVAALAAVAGLDGVLSDPNATLTLMAPTNEAFADLPGRIVNYLTSNVNTTLTFLLLGHVLPLVATAEVVVGLDGMEVTFLNNVSRTIEVSDDGVVSISCGCEGSESGARVVETDIMASNGVIHVIDRILGIPTLFEVVQTGGGALAGAFAASGLAERLRTLDGVTLFAPNTAGFQSLAETYSQLAGAVLSGNPGFTLHIQTLLLAHVADTVVFSEDLEDGMNVTMLSNDTFTVSINETVTIAPGSANGVATVVDPFDFITSQGSVHAIDAVLIPRFLQRTIVDIAVAETSTLASFVVAADLAETLSSTFGLTGTLW